MFYFGCGAAAHALVDGVVLGVDGEEGDVVFFCGRDDELAGGYEALFVGEAYGLAGADCRVGGFETRHSDDGRDYEVDLRQSRNVNGAGGAVDDFDASDGGGFEAGLESVGEGFGGEGDDLGAPAPALLEGRVDVAAGGEGDGEVAVGVGLADGKGGVSDGSGGSQDG